MNKATGHVPGSLPKNELSLHMFPKIINVIPLFSRTSLSGYIHTISTKMI